MNADDWPGPVCGETLGLWRKDAVAVNTRAIPIGPSVGSLDRYPASLVPDESGRYDPSQDSPPLRTTSARFVSDRFAQGLRTWWCGPMTSQLAWNNVGIGTRSAGADSADLLKRHAHNMTVPELRAGQHHGRRPAELNERRRKATRADAEGYRLFRSQVALTGVS